MHIIKKVMHYQNYLAVLSLCFLLSFNRCFFFFLLNFAVDGNWAAWTGWGECTESCGGGFHSRSRTCSNPIPSHGGKDCEGKPNQIRPCSTQSCPGNRLQLVFVMRGSH